MRPSVYWLFVFIPITAILDHAGNMPPPVIFFSAALAIVPVALLIVRSTEQIATRTGDAVGGLLNATFGNAPELIIALVALKAGYADMVRASIIGAILANLLLALGMAFFLGGLRYRDQKYNPAATRIYSSMMLLAAASLAVPSAFSRYFATEGTIREEELLNLGIAGVLLLTYAHFTCCFPSRRTLAHSRVSKEMRRNRTVKANAGTCRAPCLPLPARRSWRPG